MDDNCARQQRFYDASVRNRRSYAIYHLIDASGSTSAILSPARQSVVDPAREANVLDVEKAAAAAIFTAIEDLDQPGSFTQKIFLYQSDGDTSVYRAGGVSCLTRLEADLANRDGAAIRSVSGMLAAEENNIKVLFSFADGMPSDRDYRDGIRDTEMAVKEAADRGMKVFYILTKNTTGMSFSERANFNRITRFATDRKIVYDPSQLPFKTRDLFTAHLI
jgi:nitric oxide reductase activation protein